MSKKDLFLQYALSFVGVPYRWGGENPITGMDCSGLLYVCYAAFGIIKHRRTAQGYFEALGPNSELNAYEAGAAVFYGKSTRDITHVGILVSDSLMLEAGNGGPTIQTREDADLANAFVRIRPLRMDRVAVLLPNALR